MKRTPHDLVRSTECQAARLLFCSLVLVILMTWVSAPARGQAEVGELFGTVSDPSGSPLPSAAITLLGPGATREQTSGPQGHFRFLGLDPGEYVLLVARDGFANAAYSEIAIRGGHSVTLDVEMTMEITEEISVAAEGILLDERRIRKATVITQQELQTIPTPRDPWALLRQVPGVAMDLVNNGGEASGREAVFTGPGSAPDEKNYAIDGVQITDMGGVRSPGFYDFESFSEVAYTTGGSDPTLVTPGVTINMITRRGTNQWRGSARALITDAGWQSSSSLDPSKFAPGQKKIDTDQIREIYDYGLEGGGPAVADRVWLWGGWGRNQINRRAAGGIPNDILLENFSIKANGQFGENNSLVAWYSRGEKDSVGLGAGPQRAPESTYDEDLVTGVWKIEDSHVVSADLFLSGFVSGVTNDWALTPGGGIGPGAPEMLWDSDGIIKRNLFSFSQDTPSNEIQLAGSYFLGGQKASHTLTLGARYRDWHGSGAVGWPGARGLANVAGVNFGIPDPTLNVFWIHRGAARGNTEYESLWLQDTLTRERLTLNLGLRWDRQDSTGKPISVPANPVRPDLFPAIEYDGGDLPYTWSDLQPRIGATYALGTDRETLLRFSLSRFAEQLSALDSLHVSPIGSEHQDFVFGAAAYFLYVDLDGNKVYTDGEPNFLIGTDNLDPLNPSESPNRVDSGLEAQTTDELILAVERLLAPELVAHLTFTWRHVDKLKDLRPLIRDYANGNGEIRVALRDDYVFTRNVTGTLPNGQPYSTPLYSLGTDLVPTGGTYLVNGDREQEYRGLTLGFVKRLANQWSARGFVHWNDWTWDHGSEFLSWSDPTDLLGSQDNAGDVVAYSSGISGKDYTFLSSRWQVHLNGLYEVAPDRPWGFVVSGNISARQGFPLPYNSLEIGTDGVQRRVQVTETVDSFRNEDLVTVDLRIEKEFPVGNGAVALTVDGFNVLNESTVIRRDLLLNGPTPDHLIETISPRIFRLGIRLTYN